MPLWISDFMGSDAVMAFTTAQIGAYLLLLMAQWQSDQDAIPVKGVRTITRWRGPEIPLRDVLGLFSTDGESLFHPKLRRIKREREVYHDSRSSAASDAATARWERERNASCMRDACLDDASVHASAMPTKARKQGAGSTSGSDPGEGSGEGWAQIGPSGGFAEFWSAYPRRVGKAKAMKAWIATAKDRPPLEEILAKLEQLKRTRDWTEQRGRFAPHPATWINRHGWDDEPGPEGEDAFGPAPRPRFGGSNVDPETAAALEAEQRGGR